MSFATRIQDKLSNDSGISALVGTHVYGQSLPDNFNLSQDAIVTTYSMTDGISALEEENVLEIYQLFVVLISVDTVSLETIAAAVRACLDTYSDDYLRDIVFEGDLNSPDYEKERFTKSLQYRIIFNNL